MKITSLTENDNKVVDAIMEIIHLQKLEAKEKILQLLSKEVETECIEYVSSTQ